jgi:hypothetical protein
MQLELNFTFSRKRVQIICLIVLGVGIAQAVSSRLHAGWQEFSSWQRQYCSLLQSVQTGSGAHPAFYPVSTVTLSQQVRWLEHEADHTPVSSAEFKNGGAVPPFPYVLGIVLN